MRGSLARDVTVRILQEQDIAIATGLSAEAGWNQTPDDWRTLLEHTRRIQANLAIRQAQARYYG